MYWGSVSRDKSLGFNSAVLDLYTIKHDQSNVSAQARLLESKVGVLNAVIDALDGIGVAAVEMRQPPMVVKRFHSQTSSGWKGWGLLSCLSLAFALSRLPLLFLDILWHL